MTIDPATSITVNGIRCYDEGFEEFYKVRGGAGATWKLVCAWNDRRSLIQSLIGTTAGGGVNLSVNPNARSPEDPILAVSEIKTEGIGLLDIGLYGMAKFELCRMYVIFSNLDFSFGGAGGTIQLDIGEDLMLFPDDGSDTSIFKWGSGADITPAVVPALPVGLVNFCVPQAGIPQLRNRVQVDILSYVDCVNSDTFLGAAAGTVMYKGATALGRFVSGNASASVVEAHDLGHRLQWRRIPWNYWMNPATQIFDKILFKTANPALGKAAGDPFFTEKAFSPVFDPAAINNLQSGGAITGL